MPACQMKPADRRAQIKKVGEDLIQHHGKKHFYTVDQVKAANRRQGIDVDFACWSHAVFNTHEAFDAYHQSIGEACDYVAMKSEMLSSISSKVGSIVSEANEASWFDLDLSWLEFPDIDWSIFDIGIDL